MALTREALEAALNHTVAAQAQNPIRPLRVESEGLIAVTHMRFLPKFINIRKGKNGEIEQQPKKSNTHSKYQSTFITVEMDKTVGSLPKYLVKAINKNQAPLLYDKLLQAASGEEFEPFVYDGEPFQVGSIQHPKNFYIEDKTTPSGWSEDSQGRPTVHNESPFICFPDFENLPAMMRREARQKEDNGEYVNSTKTISTPTHDENGAPIQN